MKRLTGTPLPHRIQDAETEVKRLVKEGFLSGKRLERILGEVNALIRALVREIPVRTLKEDAMRSLRALAYRQYKTYERSFGSGAFLLALAGQGRAGVKKGMMSPNAVIMPIHNKGIPLQLYYKTVFEERVVPVMRELAEQRALDPNDARHKNSLRNLAEMEVRYREHLRQIAELKNNGIKLVVASAHADCSDRCAPFQGKVYSLDGTSGVTPDGRQYEPLEHATDIYYTTKAGRTYKNGLLGFNCRHYLTEYNPGMAIPFVSERERKEEYDITRRQRELERAVRAFEEQATLFKDIDGKRYREAKRNAGAAKRAYMDFSKAHGRAYYPDRVKLPT